MFTPEAGHKRFFLSAGTMPSSAETAQLLVTHFPELQGRIGVDHSSTYPATNSNPEPVDTSLAESILGMTSYRSAEETIIDTARQILDLQQRKEWRNIIQS
jgi:hypothetical protein